MPRWCSNEDGRTRELGVATSVRATVAHPRLSRSEWFAAAGLFLSVAGSNERAHLGDDDEHGTHGERPISETVEMSETCRQSALHLAALYLGKSGEAG
jgi:hypothetical protein